ncbi:hypothetical protein AVEN_271649-1 [Araneus ventricosus]|uniref:Uncharacterized protein n=1 Tax=Araneus ventricosus TaxID=182803 RepID=A0A4Y2KRL5_ARAVE|nr:hypothetical protein AVEN_271649-1 [Araneus ventricosus]
MQIEIFVIPVEVCSTILFIEDCHQCVEIGLSDVLSPFYAAEVLSSRTCFHFSKKWKVTLSHVWAMRRVIEYFPLNVSKKLLDYQNSMLSCILGTNRV